MAFKLEHDLHFDHDILPSTELNQRSTASIARESDHRRQLTSKQRVSTSHLPSPEPAMELNSGSQSQSSEGAQLPTPANEAQSYVDELAVFGARARALIKTVQKLEALQIPSTLPSLPKFVVAGDQSAGKSSIIEALCDISLPRSEGTCTRCPFQITTTATGSAQAGQSHWSCTVSLQIYYEYDTGRQSAGSFTHWHPCQLTSYTLATITSKDDLADILIRAQQAVLNPSVNPAHFIAANVQSTQVEFSPNLVCLDITGPELPDMSFYDLPGTINVVGDASQQHLVDMVGDLVKSYISDPKALVLLACAADQDIETSTTFRFIRQCSAERRCLGVLTKADLVGAHRVDRINNILQNTSFHLELGWHITKQLSSTQIMQGITHVQARSLEQSFFASQPWNALPAASNGRYGITNLQNAISERLTEHIRNDMPEIIGRVQLRLSQVDSELALFGERDANPILTIRDVVRDIQDAIRDLIKGRVSRKDFAAVVVGERLVLKKWLNEVAPTPDLSTPGFQPPNIAFTINDDDDELPITPTPSNTVSSQRSALTAGTPTPLRQKRKAPDSATPREPKRARATPVEDPSGLPKSTITLDEVDEIIRANSDNSLMAQTSTEVNNILISKAMQSWKAVLDKVLDRVADLLIKAIDSIGHQCLAKHRAAMLYPAAMGALREFVNSMIGHEFRIIHRLLERELYRPLTSREIRVNVDHAKAQLARGRKQCREKEVFETLEGTEHRTINASERAKLMKDDAFVTKHFQSDAYAASVEALALPQAYYQVAAPRFNDNVFQHIDFDLLKTIHDEAGNVLMAKLNATNADACAQLLMEDPQREVQRQQLLVEREKLVIAMHELNDLRSD